MPSPREARALARLSGQRRQVAFLARRLARRTKPGQAVARIELPRIGKTAVVVKGSDPEDLRKGPGLYDGTPFPGAPGTTAIAGHRTTYGAPFRHIDGLRRGDRIVVAMPYATFTYRVQQTQIVQPSDLSVIRRVGYDRLVLSACHPLFSAAKRIVVLRPPGARDPGADPSQAWGGRRGRDVQGPGARLRRGRLSDDASPDRSHPLPPHHRMRLDELKDKVDRSDYAVDPRLVAEALLRRFDTRRHEAVEPRVDHPTRCSYPRSGRAPGSRPLNVTSGAPSRTRPTHVSPAAARASSARSGGTQAHSS